MWDFTYHQSPPLLWHSFWRSVQVFVELQLPLSPILPALSMHVSVPGIMAVPALHTFGAGLGVGFGVGAGFGPGSGFCPTIFVRASIFCCIESSRSSKLTPSSKVIFATPMFFIFTLSAITVNSFGPVRAIFTSCFSPGKKERRRKYICTRESSSSKQC